jgi:UDP-N-acetyl-D-mannosaminuronic acid transferase (WecB/TagA/CpsF family)
VLEEREASHRALEAPRSSDLDESLERFRSRQETIALRDGVEARTIAFKGNSAEVSSDGIAKLKRIALLQRASKTPITLIGSKRDDTALTTERLEQTKKLLIQNGVKETVISTIIEELAVEQPHTITVLWRVPKQPPEGERPPLRLSAHP